MIKANNLTNLDKLKGAISNLVSFLINKFSIIPGQFQLALFLIKHLTNMVGNQ